MGLVVLLSQLFLYLIKEKNGGFVFQKLDVGRINLAFFPWQWLFGPSRAGLTPSTCRVLAFADMMCITGFCDGIYYTTVRIC